MVVGRRRVLRVDGEHVFVKGQGLVVSAGVLKEDGQIVNGFDRPRFDLAGRTVVFLGDRVAALGVKDAEGDEAVEEFGVDLDRRGVGAGGLVVGAGLLVDFPLHPVSLVQLVINPEGIVEVGERLLVLAKVDGKFGAAKSAGRGAGNGRDASIEVFQARFKGLHGVEEIALALPCRGESRIGRNGQVEIGQCLLRLSMFNVPHGPILVSIRRGWRRENGRIERIERCAVTLLARDRLFGRDGGWGSVVGAAGKAQHDTEPHTTQSHRHPRAEGPVGGVVGLGCNS